MARAMRFRFVLDGPKYSEHKGALKKLLREHGLAWKGGMTRGAWVSGKERLLAEFERDAERDVTLKATLTWEGRAKTPFLNAVKAWVFSLGGSSEGPPSGKEAKAAEEERLARELELWDRTHKPDAAALEAQGRPRAWIERDLKAWKKEREAKRHELLGE